MKTVFFFISYLVVCFGLLTLAQSVDTKVKGSYSSLYKADRAISSIRLY